MSLYDFRVELASVLRGVPGLTCDEEGVMRDSFEPPAALIDFEVGPALTFQHGAFELTGHVWLMVGRTDERSASIVLDRYRDPTDENSVWRALCDRTWTHADYVNPTGASAVQAVGLGNAEYLMVDITLEVVI